MKQNSSKVFLAVIIILGLFASFFIASQRITAEKSYKNVEIVLDWAQIQEKAQTEQITETEVLAVLADSAESILFKEATINELQEASVLQIMKGMDFYWCCHSMTAELNRGKKDDFASIELAALDLNHQYLIFPKLTEAEVAKIYENLLLKSSQPENLQMYQMQADGQVFQVIEAALTANELYDLGIGFDTKGMKLAAEEGYGIIPQIRSWEKVETGDIEAVFAELADLPVHTVIFNDNELPGYGAADYNKLAEIWAAEIKENDSLLGTIEFFPQKGMQTLAQKAENRIVRLHSISEGEMKILSRERVLDRYQLAVTDRNMRILFVRFFPQLDLAENQEFLQELRLNLTAENFGFEQADTLNSLSVLVFLYGLLILAVVAGGCYLVLQAGFSKAALVLFFLVGLGGMLLWGAGYLGLLRKLAALGAAVIFPTLAVNTFLVRQGTSLFQAVLRFLVMTLVALIGAMLMVGLLSQNEYMLALNQFAGVKAAHVLPLLFLTVLFGVLKEPLHLAWRRVKCLWEANIKVKYLIILGLLAGIFLVYLMRTGNEGMAISQWEIILRSKLDQWLLVRPRTKEFLIGHPLMILLIYLGYRQRFLPLVLVASIGQISLVNTFAHLHTPLLVSLLRTFNGIWLGVILGVSLVFLFKGYRKIWLWFDKNYLDVKK